MTQLSNLFTIDASGSYQPASANAVIAAARECMTEFLRRDVVLSSPAIVKDFLSIKLGQREREIFAVIFVDCQNRLIAYREMFRGTLTQTSVYPREILKAALALNAAGCFVSHSHPSGVCTPSEADKHLTTMLRTALSVIDVKLLDHIIAAGGDVYSFAENGLL